MVAGCALAVFALAALTQAVSGFGSALVAVPLLALVVAPVPAVVAATMVSLVLTAGAWRRDAGHADTSAVRRLVLFGLLGMPLGLVALALLPEDGLTAVIAMVLLALVVVLALGLPLPTGRSVHPAAGVVSGALLTATGMNGPPLVLALRDEPPTRFRATLQAVFCLQDVAAVVAFVALGKVDETVLVACGAGILGLPVGWLVGDVVFRRLDPRRFRAVVLVGLAVTGVVALLGVLR